MFRLLYGLVPCDARFTVHASRVCSSIQCPSRRTEVQPFPVLTMQGLDKQAIGLSLSKALQYWRHPIGFAYLLQGMARGTRVLQAVINITVRMRAMLMANNMAASGLTNMARHPFALPWVW